MPYGSAYMSNTLFLAWVKSVYSLGIVGGETCAIASTVPALSTTYPTATRVQPTIRPQVFTKFTPQLYTPISAILHLLNTYLYTVSTVPTITKTKEKKGNK